MANSSGEGISFQQGRDCYRKAAFGDNINATIDESLFCNDVYDEYLPPLWQSDFVVAVIYCSLVVVAFILGTFGNVLILVVTMTTRTLKKIGRDFFVNLALADLCVALIAEPMCILGVIMGEEWFKGKWILCEIVASMCLTACLCSFLSLTLLAFNRYMYVCHYTQYYQIFKRPVCILLCLFCWVMAFFFEFPNFFGWGDHTFDQKSHQCIWDRTADFSYTVFVSGGLIGLPLFMMAVCFILIFRKIWKSKFDVYSLNLDDPLRMRHAWLEAARSSKTLFCVFLSFIICWTPYAVIIVVDDSDEFSMEKHLFVTLLAHYHSGLNILIYTFTNRNFRTTIIALFTCGKFWKYESSLRSASKTESGKTTPISKDYSNHSSYGVLPRPEMTYVQSDNAMKKCDSLEDIIEPDKYDNVNIAETNNHI